MQSMHRVWGPTDTTEPERREAPSVFQRNENKDYYVILQVDPRADPEVIEAAYRRLALKHHPDVSGESDAGRRMRELNEAFEVLSDPARRRAYDRQRSLGGGRAAARMPISFQAVVKVLLPYLGLALLVILSLRILPLLLRPPVLAVLVVAVCVYLLLRRLR